MARAPKCKKCKEEIDKNNKDSFTKKGQYYIHVDCLEEAKEEPKVEAVVEDGEQEDKIIKCTLCENDLRESEMVRRGSFKVHQHCLDNYREQKVEVSTRQMRTCPRCKEKLNPLDEDAVDMGTATYHVGCYEKMEREKKNREELYDYVSILYNIEFPTGFMMRQIAEYYSKRGYSYKGMKMTLKYIYEVERLPVLQGTGLGLIPSYYERTKQYYKKIHSAGVSAENIKISREPRMIKVVEEKIQRRKKYNLNDY